MGNSAFGSTAADHFDFPGRYNNDHDTAVRLARTTFTISNSIILLYMTAIQYLLIRIRVSKSKIGHPSTAETYLVITALWLIHRVLDTLLSSVMDAAVEVIWDRHTVFRYLQLRDGRALELGFGVDVPIARTWQSNITLVFWEVLATWLLSKSLFLSISFLSRTLEARQNPSRVVGQLKTRFFELVVFARHLFREIHPIFHDFRTTRFSPRVDRKKGCDDWKGGKTTELRRHREENALDGQRTLHWDLKVDKESLHEIMETLGPPGGFGELGFNISQDRVCFGAMGIGTRFNLTFILETENSHNFQDGGGGGGGGRKRSSRKRKG